MRALTRQLEDVAVPQRLLEGGVLVGQLHVETEVNGLVTRVDRHSETRVQRHVRRSHYLWMHRNDNDEDVLYVI